MLILHIFLRGESFCELEHLFHQKFSIEMMHKEKRLMCLKFFQKSIYSLVCSLAV